MKHTNLQNANIKGADLAQANVDGCDMTAAKYNEITNLVGIENIGKAKVDEDLLTQHNKQEWHNRPLHSAGKWGYNKGKNTLLSGYNFLKSVVTGIIPTSLGGGIGFAFGVITLLAFFPSAGIAAATMLVGGCTLSCAAVGYFVVENSARHEAWLNMKELAGISRPFTEHDKVAHEQNVGPDLLQHEHNKLHDEVLIDKQQNMQQQQSIPSLKSQAYELKEKKDQYAKHLKDEHKNSLRTKT